MTAIVNETIEDTIELIKICVFLFLQEIETTKPRKLTVSEHKNNGNQSTKKI